MGMKNVRRKEYHKEYGNEECEKEQDKEYGSEGYE